MVGMFLNGVFVYCSFVINSFIKVDISQLNNPATILFDLGPDFQNFLSSS